MLFECHITISIAHSGIGYLVAETLHWFTSQIERDPVLGKGSYFYLTSHSKDYMEMWTRLRAAVQALESNGAEVIREKIELIMHDTKVKV